MKATIKTVNNQALKNLEGMIERGRSSQAFLARVAYPLYQARQMKKFMTEGASEGTPWKELKPKYADWKRINFAGWPGHGMKMLIRTGELAEGVIGRKLAGDVVSDASTAAGPGHAAGHFVMITDKSLTVATSVPYAKYVSARRPLFNFNEDFAQQLRSRYKAWVIKGQA